MNCVIKKGEQKTLAGRHYKKVTIRTGGKLVGVEDGCTIENLFIHKGASASFEPITVKKVT